MSDDPVLISSLGDFVERYGLPVVFDDRMPQGGFAVVSGDDLRDAVRDAPSCRSRFDNDQIGLLGLLADAAQRSSRP